MRERANNQRGYICPLTRKFKPWPKPTAQEIQIYKEMNGLNKKEDIMKKKEVIIEMVKGGMIVTESGLIRKYENGKFYCKFESETAWKVEDINDLSATYFKFEIYKEPVKLEVNPILNKVAINKENPKIQFAITGITRDGDYETANDGAYHEKYLTDNYYLVDRFQS